ncbi:TRAM/LAG1/CLN8 homology domain [Trypanosoma melophagium]|uniref:TRAM/LAG1/CLN8 homology domain n=1 Tax=Trypanosoma melophagium TaxID=715481 RepID=UPI00351A8144|nr:TRAM/LAG1/CLN8 homology domain [Trypanosoma melophagium]
MGHSDAYDIYIAPLVRDFTVFFPMFLAWFVVQWGASHLLPLLFGPAFKRLSREKRVEVIVRTVSVCNGLLMTGAAVCFLSDLRANNFIFHNDQYREIPGYRFFRITIMSYFAWDIVVCIMYRWSVIWKVHAVASFIGAYLLSFPFSDHYGSYFTGMFELSNSPLHLSSIARTLEIPSLIPFATVMEGLFAVLFVCVRVVGGSIVAASWLKHTCMNLVANYYAGGTLVHGELPLIISIVLLVVIQTLQYIWFAEIVKRIMAMFCSSSLTTNAVKKCVKVKQL